MLKASICTIGDEILIGQIVDTNSSALSRALGSLGIKVTGMLSIGDDRQDIISTLSTLLSQNDIVITTGGLGPTKDDITKEALAALCGSTGWYEHAGQLEIIHRILRSRGLDVLDVNRAQARVPEGCEVIENKLGTAPVMAFRMAPGRFSHPCTLYALPGVPFEAVGAIPDVMEDIRTHHRGELSDVITHRNVMTYGIAESALAKMISHWEDALPPEIHLAYLPDPLVGVKLRLSIYGGNEQENGRILDSETTKLLSIIGPYVYACQEDSLEHAVGTILRKHGKTLSAAESCTGGEISHLITTVPGSSAYYLGSVTSYAISVKERVLGVDPDTIRKNGVVSAQVAEAMATGVRRLTGSDYSVSTTGLAGPGGDDFNPEGTVWIAVSSEQKTISRKFNFRNDRKRNIERFAASALYLLLGMLREELES